MLDLLKDLWGFMRERKKLWMAPIIGIMLLLGILHDQRSPTRRLASHMAHF